MDLVLARHRGHHRLAPIAPDGLSDDGPTVRSGDRPIRGFVPNLVKNLMKPLRRRPCGCL